MSPTVNRSPRRLACVFPGSLWYSNCHNAWLTYTRPATPGGHSFPSSSRILSTTPLDGLPTVPGLRSHSSDVTVVPAPSVDEYDSTMIGPHQSIIRRFTSTGHGAPACVTSRSDETSAAPRTSSGSASSRWNIVGTMLAFVTRYRATRSRNASGVQRSSITSSAPLSSAPHASAMGAAWYIGPHARSTRSSGSPVGSLTNDDEPRPMPPTRAISSAGRFADCLLTPLGFPVVPDV